MRSKTHVKLHLILRCFFDFFWSVLGRFSVSAWIENGRKIHNKIASQTKTSKTKNMLFDSAGPSESSLRLCCVGSKIIQKSTQHAAINSSKIDAQTGWMFGPTRL